MATPTDLSDAIDRLRQIQAQMTSISDRTDEGRKMDLVNLRRSLAVQIGKVSDVAEQTFLSSADSEISRQFRALLSTMRRATALHQANFPAVMLDEQSAAYDLSVRSVRDANAKFMQWVTQNIPRA